jgi:hypothetical protein
MNKAISSVRTTRSSSFDGLCVTFWRTVVVSFDCEYFLVAAVDDFLFRFWVVVSSTSV